MRQEAQKLSNLGPLPDCETAEEEQLKMYESLLSSVTPPISDAEARSLVHSLGQTSAMGLLGPCYT